MRFLSTKLKNILFGNIRIIHDDISKGKTLTYPRGDGNYGAIRWKGNVGLIVTMWRRILRLEKTVKIFKEYYTDVDNDSRDRLFKLEEKMNALKDYLKVEEHEVKSDIPFMDSYTRIVKKEKKK